MGKKKTKKQADEAIAPQPSSARNYQIPGVEVRLCSRGNGVPVAEFLSLAFNIASANPEATVAFGLIIDPTDDD